MGRCHGVVSERGAEEPSVFLNVKNRTGSSLEADRDARIRLISGG